MQASTCKIRHHRLKIAWALQPVMNACLAALSAARVGVPLGLQSALRAAADGPQGRLSIRHFNGTIMEVRSPNAVIAQQALPLLAARPRCCVCS